jgi:hypothetical protein
MLDINRTISLLCVGAALALAGCGQRLAQQTSDSAPWTQDGSPASDLASPPRSCLIAIRLDVCCAVAEPATKQQVQQDPCLVPYPHSGPAPAGCKPPDCAAMCMDPRPKSRLVRALPGGGCTWDNECSGDSDCGFAVDLRQCCSAWTIFPRSLTAADPCLYIVGDDATRCGARCPNPRCSGWPPTIFPSSMPIGLRPRCLSSPPPPTPPLWICGPGSV